MCRTFEMTLVLMIVAACVIRVDTDDIGHKLLCNKIKI